jgi:hypothetical protein
MFDAFQHVEDPSGYCMLLCAVAVPGQVWMVPRKQSRGVVVVAVAVVVVVCVWCVCVCVCGGGGVGRKYVGCFAICENIVWCSCNAQEMIER